MTKLLNTLLLSLTLGLGHAYAAEEAAKKEPSPAQKAQQEKMRQCNKDAKDKTLKGDERKAFMKECLSAKAAPETNQRDKMKLCNNEAGEKSLKGDERKAFMSECLKK